ncbi:MAG: ferulic acid esterase [Chloroflexi bacterium]|nr:ferulic acid esterase [Chloroflexota bacterium]
MKPWLKWLLRIPLILLGLLVVSVLALLIAYLLSDRTNGTITSAGEEREYLLYVPATYDPSTPTALVISIHGFLQWPAHQSELTGWNDLADEFGFIVVHPSGTGFPKRWRTNGEPGSETDPALDVAFISDLIAKLESEYNIDPARIYANGLSNGGGMSVRLACVLPGRIAAVGTVAGAYTFPWSDCRSTRPVPTIVFHGTDDPVVPYNGGPSHRFDIPFPAIPDWVAELGQRNGCNAPPLYLPSTGTVTGVRYYNCLDNAEVIFYSVGGGHSWPGGGYLPGFLVGEINMDIDATRMIWEFFQQHPLEGE